MRGVEFVPRPTSDRDSDDRHLQSSQRKKRSAVFVRTGRRRRAGGMMSAPKETEVKPTQPLPDDAIEALAELWCEALLANLRRHPIPIPSGGPASS
jgi:hypothetical protein